MKQSSPHVWLGIGSKHILKHSDDLKEDNAMRIEIIISSYQMLKWILSEKKHSDKPPYLDNTSKCFPFPLSFLMQTSRDKAGYCSTSL